MTTSVRLGDADGNTLLWIRPQMASVDDAIFCEDDEIPMAGPRVVDQARPGRSGIIDRTGFHDGTTYKASIIIQDTSDGTSRHEWADTLRGLVAPSQRPYLYVQRDGWPGERRAQVRGDSFSFVSNGQAAVLLRGSLQLVIPDGEFEDSVQQMASIFPLAASVGVSFPISFPLSFTVSASPNAVILTSGGNQPTPPLLRIYGACTDPAITNTTTGQQIKFSGLSVTAGSYLDVDVAGREVLMNGDPNLSFYSKLDFTQSTWWEIQPGQNLITVTTTSQDSSCELYVFWRDRWA